MKDDFRVDSRTFPDTCVQMEFPFEIALKVEEIVDYGVSMGKPFDFPSAVCMCIEFAHKILFDDKEC